MTNRTSLQPHSLGHVFEDANVTVFFGNRESTLERLALSFPDLRLIEIRQIHSDRVILSPVSPPVSPPVSHQTIGVEAQLLSGPAREILPEADAHYTRERRTAICVKTADCIPVMIYDPSSGLIASVHAGWRGVANGIITKTAQQLGSHGASLERARAWIGPHIMATSFEVGLDVAQLLEASFESVRGFASVMTSLLDHPSGQHKRVDLLSIARAQLRSVGIESDRTTELAIDTFVSAEHSSYRREKGAAGRQISFIALKN